MMNLITELQDLRRAMKAYAKDVPDEQAATFPSLYDAWKSGEAVKAGDRRYYPGTGKVYKAAQEHTTQADWTPDVTPALWTVLDVTHTGAQEDPIPASRGMEFTYGLYYTDPEDSKLYLCQRPGEADGGKITLQHLPHELIGSYFVEV